MSLNCELLVDEEVGKGLVEVVEGGKVPHLTKETGVLYDWIEQGGRVQDLRCSAEGGMSQSTEDHDQ